MADLASLTTADLLAARARLLKDYNPDEPRDDAGRWTLGGDPNERDASGQLTLAAEVAYRASLDKSLEGMPYSWRERVKDACVGLRNDFPGVPFTVRLGDTMDRASAQTFGHSIVLNTDVWTAAPGSPRAWSPDNLNAGRTPGWVAVPTVEGLVAHEFGHVLDNQARGDKLTALAVWDEARNAFQPDNALGRLIWRYEYGHGRGDNASGYATVKQTLLGRGGAGDPKNENWAEWCSIALTPGNPRYGEPRAAEVRQTLQDAGYYRPIWAAAAKYSEDQPRVPAGSPDGGEFASAGDGGVQSALDAFRARAVAASLDGVERGAILDGRTGAVLVEKTGISAHDAGMMITGAGGAVVWDTNDLIDHGKGNVMTHTHPGPEDVGLSDGDIRVAMAWGLKSIVAESPTMTWTMSPPDGWRERQTVAMGELGAGMAKAYNDAMNAYFDSLSPNQVPWDEMMVGASDAACRAAAAYIGWDYTRTVH